MEAKLSFCQVALPTTQAAAGVGVGVLVGVGVRVDVGPPRVGVLVLVGVGVLVLVGVGVLVLVGVGVDVGTPIKRSDVSLQTLAVPGMVT